MEDRLERFVKAQEGMYEIAFEEMKAGYKESHWIWYIFPQLKELGYSPTAKYYGIENKEEAIAYIKHPILGKRLIEISKVLLKNKDSDPLHMMGYPDHLKLCSCMTLFDEISDEVVFGLVLEKYYQGKKDQKTIDFLKA